MAKRQFPTLKVSQASPPASAKQVLIHGNVAGLSNLLMLVQEAIEDRQGTRDEAGQTRYGCKHGPEKWLSITVRNDDVFEALPECPHCKGLCACSACHGSGRQAPERCFKDLPFFT